MLKYGSIAFSWQSVVGAIRMRRANLQWGLGAAALGFAE
jgi:hypothetical protein